MADEEHLRILRQGVGIWNLWRNEHRYIRPDLSGADLRAAHPIGANLGGANLEGANLCEACLSGADFARVHLYEANLGKADLRRANLNLADLDRTILTEANLSLANLSFADLRRAILARAKLSSSDFSRAIIGWTDFGMVNLSVVKGLKSVTHAGPSTIGIDTVYASQGRIPEVFLRGAGVPDVFIAYISSFITGKAIQFYSCFPAIRAETRTLPNACMPTCRPRAYAAGSRRKT